MYSAKKVIYLIFNNINFYLSLFKNKNKFVKIKIRVINIILLLSD